MTLPAYLAIARAAQEESMTATCTISRPGTGGARVFDKATGTYSDPTPAVIYKGRCKVRSTARAVAEAEAGEREVAVVDLTLGLPIDAASAGVRRDDVAVIDSNPDDEALVGRRFIVRAGSHGTAKTARRLPIEEVV